MKYLYLFLFMGFTVVLSGQEKQDQPTPKSQDSQEFDLYPNPAVDDVVYITTANNAGKDITKRTYSTCCKSSVILEPPSGFEPLA